VLYLDSSAIVKLVVAEPDSAALVGELRSDPEAVSSAIARVEVLRAARRVGGRRMASRAGSVLERMALVRLDHDILESAATLEPMGLRTLDALHMATALAVGEDLAAFVSYDMRLTKAAEAAGLPVLTPRDPTR